MFVNPAIPSCDKVEGRTPEQIKGDVAFLKGQFAPFKEVKPKFNDLIDPYIVAAVADFTVLTFGQTENATFLSLMQNRYPSSHEFFHPGEISLFHQLAVSKSRSESWPLEDIIGDLNNATSLNQRVIERARAELRAEPDQCEMHANILSTYNRNKFMLLETYLEAFYQRALGGETIKEPQRADWKIHFRELEGILNAKTWGVPISLSDLPAREIKGDESIEWTSADIDPDFELDARVGMALSSVLLTEHRGKAPAEACAAARYYLNQATEYLPPLVTQIDDMEEEQQGRKGTLKSATQRCPKKPTAANPSVPNASEPTPQTAQTAGANPSPKRPAQITIALSLRGRYKAHLEKISARIDSSCGT
jgi:hypothetical protein